jgi:hypothetical protein
MKLSRVILAITAFIALTHSASAGPAPVQVPETGSTLGFLAVTFVAIAALRRRFAR